MNNYFVESTKSSPEVNFDAGSGVLRLTGESYPENSFEFYAPLLAWLQEFIDTTTLPVRLALQLSYINTGTVKCLLDLFDQLEEAAANGRDVGISWYYDPANERALETGEEFAEDLKVPFELIGEKF